ncbi:hypothetical protein D8B26_000976 [Coccidioides posadasii str. Silveira]|uniref:amidase n=1 Tax=Coccidioides posadasii (strain RMSCC 757 / Silveira) TaxID=443226 RepID=E9CUI6_COCPS|nr:acetamidase [Coccidioides posadasii str. Silveira]QVM06263.1 hypothetical protein D8B26_000976 [Coccidioides posadasii str. Silveira]
MATVSWQQKAQSIRDYRDGTLAKVEPPLKDIPDPLPLNSQGLPRQYLTEREFELTQNYDAIALLEMLRTKKVTSEELTRAFLRRAALAQKAVNCVTELMWDEAIARAKYLDSLKEPVGPLHGLPISIKEHHGMKGKKVHANFIAWADDDSADNLLNNILYDAGCVFYVRTTGPQALMHLECESSIYGRTVNPYNRNLTSGGSSGGEGALVAFGGSVLGVGGDIGGSVRNPASNNGVYGFKPTCKRLPVGGIKLPMEGKDAIAATFGPLCRSRETVNLFMKVIADAEPWRFDASLSPLPWASVTFNKPLKIAVQWDDGVVKPHPPVLRALREVAEACKKAGMEVVDWVSYDHRKAWDIISELYWPDAGKEVLDLFKSTGEPILPLTKFILEQPRVRDHNMAEYWKLCLERDSYRDAYAAHWSATANSPTGEVDLILCPTTPGVAPPHEAARYWCYTSQWNLLDYPAAVFPVTTVDLEKDVREEGYAPRNEHDRFNYDLYTGPQRFEGAPVSLQVVGRRFYDEKVMAGLAAIEKAMGRN